VGEYRVGKGKSYEKYVMMTLRTMYEAEVMRFTVKELASWGGLPVTQSMRDTLDALVKRGWLGVEPQELREGRRATVYTLSSCVWFGSQAKGKS
jgi:DNA-binding PadR family transcriptional regulator